MWFFFFFFNYMNGLLKQTLKECFWIAIVSYIPFVFILKKKPISNSIIQMVLLLNVDHCRCPDLCIGSKTNVHPFPARVGTMWYIGAPTLGQTSVMPVIRIPRCTDTLHSIINQIILPPSEKSRWSFRWAPTWRWTTDC